MTISPDRASELVADVIASRVRLDGADPTLAPGQVLDIVTGGAGRLLCDLLMTAVLAGADEASGSTGME